ncbi:ubiquitin-like small modifier protein 1 [Halorubrum cibi]|uniref:Molybdopterin synthase sulfur carrier subunit n=1 Tax=Halorubrum cibi TaxID=413815 RepID=A0A521ELA6_9EURY|nr:ubiquitin-like small modifier protein 1 [Halorubrum cibi]SMO83920.1 molybdopterin synthase sulfur carrier subunit [Halorubrum cibi]
MLVVFRAYGPVRDVVGSKTVDRELPPGATLEDLLTGLLEEHPDLTDLLCADGDVGDAVSLTVDGVNVSRLDGLETTLSAGDEVRAAPPIHGG